MLITADLYGWDDFNESGIIVNKRGDLKTYQTVLAVGDDAKFVKPGDKVKVYIESNARHFGIAIDETIIEQ